MKKRFTVILSLVFAVCLCFALTACSGLFGFGSSNNGGSSSGSGGNSGNNSGSSSSGGSSAPKEDSDGTFIYSGASIKAANTSISGDITIPAERNGTPIDTIPADAFKGCNAITSITVPESVTTIGAGAFNGCSSLRSITLPFVGGQKGNTGNSARFGYIFGMNSYQGSTSVPCGQAYASYHIPSGLRTVTITNESVIGYGAFMDCSMLTTINLNDEIIQIGEFCFDNCTKITEVNLPNISIIPASLFSGCVSLSKFTINSSVDTIGESAFKGCSSLSSINSKVAGEFIIPNAIMSIGSGAFNGCFLIKNITLPFVGSQKGNTGSSSRFGYIFGTNSYQGSIGVPSGQGAYTSYYIPTGLRTVTITNESVIGYGAFMDCSMIQSLTINKGAQNSVGEKAFENTAKPTWV